MERQVRGVGKLPPNLRRETQLQVSFTFFQGQRTQRYVIHGAAISIFHSGRDLSPELKGQIADVTVRCQPFV